MYNVTLNYYMSHVVVKSKWNQRCRTAKPEPNPNLNPNSFTIREKCINFHPVGRKFDMLFIPYSCILRQLTSC